MTATEQFVERCRRAAEGTARGSEHRALCQFFADSCEADDNVDLVRSMLDEFDDSLELLDQWLDEAEDHDDTCPREPS